MISLIPSEVYKATVNLNPYILKQCDIILNKYITCLYDNKTLFKAGFLDSNFYGSLNNLEAFFRNDLPSNKNYSYL